MLLCDGILISSNDSPSDMQIGLGLGYDRRDGVALEAANNLRASFAA